MQDLTQEEQIELQALLDQLSEEVNYSVTLKRLIEKWWQVVQQVERGYQDDLFEYLNDLDTSRTFLQELLDKGSPSLQKKIQDEIKDFDARFWKATCPVEKEISKSDASQNWWFERVPIKPGLELENDLTNNLRDIVP